MPKDYPPPVSSVENSRQTGRRGVSGRGLNTPAASGWVNIGFRECPLLLIDENESPRYSLPCRRALPTKQDAVNYQLMAAAANSECSFDHIIHDMGRNL